MALDIRIAESGLRRFDGNSYTQQKASLTVSVGSDWMAAYKQFQFFVDSNGTPLSPAQGQVKVEGGQANVDEAFESINVSAKHIIRLSQPRGTQEIVENWSGGVELPRPSQHQQRTKEGNEMIHVMKTDSSTQFN